MALRKGFGVMHSKFLRFVLMGLLIILLVSCADERQPPRPAGKVAAEAQAPNFTLKDLSGNSVKLNDLQGNPVLVIFSATWCPECRREIPYFKQIYATYHPRGLQVINIDIMEPRDRVQKFADKYELPYRTLLDENGRVAENYGVYGIPTALLIDKTGKILCYPCRSLDLLLDMIFASK
jgi:peroxiredoxin